MEHEKNNDTKREQAPKRRKNTNANAKLTESTVRDLLENAIQKGKSKVLDSGVDLSVNELCKLLQMLKEYEDEDTPAEIEVKWVDPGESSKET